MYYRQKFIINGKSNPDFNLRVSENPMPYKYSNDVGAYVNAVRNDLATIVSFKSGVLWEITIWYLELFQGPSILLDY